MTALELMVSLRCSSFAWTQVLPPIRSLHSIQMLWCTLLWKSMFLICFLLLSKVL